MKARDAAKRAKCPLSRAFTEKDCVLMEEKSSVDNGENCQSTVARPVTSGLSRAVRDGCRIGPGGLAHVTRGRPDAVRRTVLQAPKTVTANEADEGRVAEHDVDIIPSLTSETKEDSLSDAANGVMKSPTVSCKNPTAIVMGNRIGAASTRVSSTSADATRVRLGDVEMGDLDAADESSCGLIVSPCDASHVWLTLPAGSRLDADTAVSLRMLMFGESKKDFPEEWRMQSFPLNGVHPELSYGLVQHKGGPCGVLASVQAHLLKELLFPKGRRTRREGSLRGSTGSTAGFSDAEVRRCLALALAAILWKTGSRKMAIVAFPSDRSRLDQCDGLVEKMDLMKFNDLTALQSFLCRHVGWYSSSSGACIAFLYSAVLSRTVHCVREDMDEAGNCLIGAHGYCSQEVINLLLTGRATSNVFDDAVTLGGEGSDSRSTLRGVTGRSDFGFLALFEHYGSCRVGLNLKCPRYPIWVVCSESHYSVLFARQFVVADVRPSVDVNDTDVNDDDKATETVTVAPAKFDLYFYDGLQQQDHEIRLTVEIGSESGKAERLNKEPVSPLELCIRTKWKGAVVGWNGSEPLL